jgi:phage-related protein
MALRIKLKVVFFQLASGEEPVRKWLKSLSAVDRQTIGRDLKTLQFGWPIGMPLFRLIDAGMWELRINLTNRIARILFAVGDGTVVLLHGFIKKQQATPLTELRLTKVRLAAYRRCA